MSHSHIWNVILTNQNLNFTIILKIKDTKSQKFHQRPELIKFFIYQF